MPTSLLPRDLYPVERPDTVLENTIAAVRAFGAPSNPEILLLKPVQLIDLLGGKLIAYTTSGGDTILLAYGE